MSPPPLDRPVLLAGGDVLLPETYRRLAGELVVAALRAQPGVMVPTDAAAATRAHAIRELLQTLTASVAATDDGNAEAVAGEDRPSSPAPISVKATAELLQVTPRRVTQLLTSGDIDGQKLGRTWLVDLHSVQQHLETRSHRG